MPPSADDRRHAPVTDRQARDLPLDAHLHTDLSPDSNVPIDTYAAAALERGIAEIAITDHVDFEPGAPAFALHDLRGPRADRPRRRRALGTAGRPDPVRGRAHLRPLVGGGHPRPPRAARLRLHDRVGPRPGRLAVQPAQRRGLGRGPIAAPRSSRPSFDEVEAAARSGLFDAIGHIDVVKRYLYPHVRPAAFEAAPELYEPILRALVESGHGPRGQHQRPALHDQARRSRIPAIVARFRELGGRARDGRLGRPPRRARELGPRRRLRDRRGRPVSTR